MYNNLPDRNFLSEITAGDGFSGETDTALYRSVFPVSKRIYKNFYSDPQKSGWVAEKKGNNEQHNLKKNYIGKKIRKKAEFKQKKFIIIKQDNNLSSGKPDKVEQAEGKQFFRLKPVSDKSAPGEILSISEIKSEKIYRYDSAENTVVLVSGGTSSESLQPENILVPENTDLEDVLTETDNQNITEQNIHSEKTSSFGVLSGNGLSAYKNHLNKKTEENISAVESYTEGLYTNSERLPVKTFYTTREYLSDLYSYPAVDHSTMNVFREKYFNQKELEVYLGRNESTLCCAAAISYPVIMLKPDIGKEELFDAIGAACNSSLKNRSKYTIGDKVVAENGYVNSINQFNYELSKNLGLNKTLVYSEIYETVEDAFNNGETIIKLSLKGTYNKVVWQHNVLIFNGILLDPVGTKGIEEVWDKNSAAVTKVMGLKWKSIK